MRRLLLVIDMQNDFIDGALGTLEAEAVVDRVVEKIQQYPEADILATRDTHPENYLETQEGRHLPVVHCVKGTPGWELNDKIAAALKDVAERVETFAQDDDLDITLVGLCTDICVVSNALLLKTFLPETPIRVIADCCAGVTPESHRAALDTMRMCQIQIQ